MGAGLRHQVLLGATGTGKTFTAAKVIEAVQKPTLVMAHNKTLAAQLYQEFKEFFPENAVEYFVSYYDYFQPEAYLPRSDTYIEKDSSRNDEIDRLRHNATRALFERRDVIIVASVSCIYGIGAPIDYGATVLNLKVGGNYRRDGVLRHLVDLQYQRNDAQLTRSQFRVRGDVLEFAPVSGDYIVRVDFFGDEIERIVEVDDLTGEVLAERPDVNIYPATHYVTPRDKLLRALVDIEAEMEERVGQLRIEGRELEAARLQQRTQFDLEMMREVGLLLRDRELLAPPRRPRGRLTAVDPDRLLPDRLPADRGREPHLGPAGARHVQERSDPQGDPGRLRLPAAIGARQPAAHLRGVRGPHEPGGLHERHARPVRDGARRAGRRAVHPADRRGGSADQRAADHRPDRRPDRRDPRHRRAAASGCWSRRSPRRWPRTWPTTSPSWGSRCSGCTARSTRSSGSRSCATCAWASTTCWSGINLLREGLDLPEVTLVAILDADKEGFLRSGGSLIQVIGRAARNIGGRVIMYADRVTDSMQAAIDETERRRAKQIAYNTEHGIVPETIIKEIRDIHEGLRRVAEERAELQVAGKEPEELAEMVGRLEAQMKEAARNLEFERAAAMRDEILQLRRLREELAAAPGSIPAEVYAAAAEAGDGAGDPDGGSEASRVFSTAATPNIIAAGSRRRPPRQTP